MSLLALAVLLGALAGDGDAVARGRQLYRTGTSAQGVALAARIVGAEPLPASSVPCATCHGLDGAGGVEGGLRVPDLRPARLAAPYGTRDPRAGGGWRPAYDARALAAAIEGGVDPAGRALDPAMPRYALGAGERADLLAYLAVLGNDPGPGVSAHEVRFGALLPLSGPAAARGRAVQALLERRFAALGTLHGRRVRLLARDCGADAEAALAAARALCSAEEGVLAFVAGSDAGAARAVLDELALLGVPVLGPLAGAPEEPERTSVFHLLPSLSDQGRAAARHLAETAPGARIHCAASDEPAARTFAAAFLAEARRLGLAPCAEPEGAARHVLLGAREFVAARLAEQPPSSAPFLCAAALLGAPPEFPGRAFELVAPPLELGLSAGEERFRAELAALGELPGLERELFALGLAHAAAELAEQALAAAGRALERASFVRALEGQRALATGVLPPLAFGRERHAGTRASLVLGFDPSGACVARALVEPAASTAEVAR